MEDDAAAAAVAEAEAEAEVDAVSKVLGDDLLVEILLRVGFPTTLVRASLVCKRWFHHVSGKAFHRRFRKLNPPRILGFYIAVFQGSPRFVPMLPQPPELAAFARIVQGYSLGVANDVDPLVEHDVFVQDCRNGSISTELLGRRRQGLFYHLEYSVVKVHSPLCPERAMAIDRPLSPQHQHPRHRGPHQTLVLTREEEDGGLSYFCVLLENPMELDITSATNFTAHVFILEDGAWRMLASATTRIDGWRGMRAVLVDNKIYIMATYIEITVLDLTTSTFSTIQLPQGPAQFKFMISRADDVSGVYLVLVKEHQLGIWLHNGDSWSFVDTFCLKEMCANLMMSDSRVKDVLTFPLWINHLGDNAEFVILQMGRFVFYLDTRCRTLHTLNDQDLPFDGNLCIRPFMMIWRPTFPALRCDPTRSVM